MLLKKKKNVPPITTCFYIYFYSYDFIFLNKAFFYIKYFYKKMLFTFNSFLPLNYIYFGKIIFLKKRKKCITVLRSPHGHKKTMEHFIFNNYKAFVKFSINTSNISDIKRKVFVNILFRYMLHCLCLNLFQNVFIIVKKREIFNK